ncbi:MAG TPA: glycosyltransferase 87 family protein [Thermodesulfobacteriota bacterium]|nr:glycosyltransferase 87 family protein [Thermodesulfobacteriota bacterium]
MSVIQNRCFERRETILKAAIWFMSFLAVSRLAYQLWRLLLNPGWNGAIDLRIMYESVNQWFKGEALRELIHLPATYAIIWPLTGWLSFESARWLWAVLYAVSLVWLFRIVAAETGIKKREEILFAALFILSIYPTGITIGNGQVILFLLPCILTAVFMEREHESGIIRDIILSLLFLISSLKITVTAPFFLIALITQRAIRPLTIAACGYLILTYVAISYRDAGLVETLKIWMHDCSAVAARGGYANIHIWLITLGLERLIFPASFVLIAAFSLWLFKFRKTDIWIQLGVAAIVARIWTYHRLYDDLLILVPIIAIFRIVRNNQLSPNERLAADLLLVITWLALLSPGTFLQLPPPLGTLFRTGQAVIWLSLLVFLVYYSYKAVRTGPA